MAFKNICKSMAIVACSRLLEWTSPRRFQYPRRFCPSCPFEEPGTGYLTISDNRWQINNTNFSAIISIDQVLLIVDGHRLLWIIDVRGVTTEDVDTSWDVKCPHHVLIFTQNKLIYRSMEICEISLNNEFNWNL